MIYELLPRPSRPELQEIERIYEASFPVSERKPFAWIVAGVERDEYLTVVARGESAILGFALLLPLAGLPWVLLEYLAVREGERSNGIGGNIMRAAVDSVRTREVDLGLVVEVEPPVPEADDLRNRRIRFYERLGGGLVELSAGYGMPNFGTGQGSMPLRLMLLPMENQPERAEATALVTGIYAAAYEGWEAVRDEVLAEMASAF